MTERSIGAGASASEVRPEELTELVERLHRRQERLSVGDVAETLSVPPEEVAATLDAMRRERVPPVAHKVAHHSDPRHRIRRIGVFASLAFLVFGSAFWAGRLTGLKATRFDGPALPLASVVSSSETLANRLRIALPEGASVTVGDLTYTGAPGSIYAGEDELVPLLEALFAQEADDLPFDPSGEKVANGDLGVFRVDAGKVPPGLGLRKTELRFQGRTYRGAFPYRAATMAPSATVDETVRLMRSREARVLANRITEWAKGSAAP